MTSKTGTKRTMVNSMQPRSTPKATTATSTNPSTPTSRSPPKNRSIPTRSTRSTGKADHYIELEGSPKMAAMEKRKQAAAERRNRHIKQDSDEEEGEGEQGKQVVSESEDELMLQPTPSKKAPLTPVKRQKTTHIPSPARSTTSTTSSRGFDSDSSEEEAEVEKVLLRTPQRKRPTPAKQLITPKTSPSKKRTAGSSAPQTSSPLKQSTTPIKRRASIVLSDSEAEPKRSASRKTPTKPKPSPSKITPSKITPTSTRLARSDSSTPSRSSLRNQRLPPDQSGLKNAPAVLRNRLVGFHMEDDGYGVNVETKEESESEAEEEQVDEEAIEQRRKAKGKGRAIEVDEEPEQAMEQDEEDPFVFSDSRPLLADEDYTLPTPPSTNATPEVITTSESSNSTYPSSFLYTHLHRQLSILTGAALPESRLQPDTTSPKFDKGKGVMGYPFLEGGYSDWEKPLRGCLNEVVTRGMGNAVVLLGPRGVGKTMLIERTLRIMSYVHGDQHDFVTVRLSGLVHTTDRLALRSIAMQMREQGFKSVGEGEDAVDEGDYSSNSATMTTLLRLLEPSSTNLAATEESSKPIILIVDEFDLFALHPRQSFLYCLLDIVQGNRRRGGVGVVGVSSRVDCLSLLEKRVRSRCQSHVLQMMLSSSLTDFLSLAQRLMSTDQRLWELVKGRDGGEWAGKWNKEVERFLGDKKVKEYFEVVWRIGGNVPTELRSILTHLFSRLDHKLSHSALSTEAVPRLEYSDLKIRESHLTRDITLKSLSTIELAVLIACKHLSASTIDFQSGFNLEMAYDQYTQWTRSLEAKGKRVGRGAMSRDAFCSGFDTLRLTELILPLSTTSSITPPSASYLPPSRSIPFKMHRLVPREAEIKLEVEKRRDLDGELRKWCGA